MQDQNDSNKTDAIIPAEEAATEETPEQAVAPVQAEAESAEDTEDRQLEVRSPEEVAAEEAEQETLPEPYIPRLTEKQQKIWQIVAGLVSGASIMLTLWLGALFSQQGEQNFLTQWLFLILFAAVMLIRTQVEKRTGVVLRYFMKYLLISAAVTLGIFVIWGVTTGAFSTTATPAASPSPSASATSTTTT